MCRWPRSTARRGGIRARLVAETLQEQSGGAPRIALGEPFPELVLPGVEDGRPRSISQFRGQKLALHVFASW